MIIINSKQMPIINIDIHIYYVVQFIMDGYN
jgi:hypothetical protein